VAAVLTRGTVATAVAAGEFVFDICQVVAVVIHAVAADFSHAGVYIGIVVVAIVTAGTFGVHIGILIGILVDVVDTAAGGLAYIGGTGIAVAAGIVVRLVHATGGGIAGIHGTVDAVIADKGDTGFTIAVATGFHTVAGVVVVALIIIVAANFVGAAVNAVAEFAGRAYGIIRGIHAALSANTGIAGAGNAIVAAVIVYGVHTALQRIANFVGTGKAVVTHRVIHIVLAAVYRVTEIGGAFHAVIAGGCLGFMFAATGFNVTGVGGTGHAVIAFAVVGGVDATVNRIAAVTGAVDAIATFQNRTGNTTAVIGFGVFRHTAFLTVADVFVYAEVVGGAVDTDIVFFVAAVEGTGEFIFAVHGFAGDAGVVHAQFHTVAEQIILAIGIFHAIGRLCTTVFIGSGILGNAPFFIGALVVVGGADTTAFRITGILGATIIVFAHGVHGGMLATGDGIADILGAFDAVVTHGVQRFVDTALSRHAGIGGAINIIDAIFIVGHIDAALNGIAGIIGTVVTIVAIHRCAIGAARGGVADFFAVAGVAIAAHAVISIVLAAFAHFITVISGAFDGIGAIRGSAVLAGALHADFPAIAEQTVVAVQVAGAGTFKDIPFLLSVITIGFIAINGGTGTAGAIWSTTEPHRTIIVLGTLGFVAISGGYVFFAGGTGRKGYCQKANKKNTVK